MVAVTGTYWCLAIKEAETLAGCTHWGHRENRVSLRLLHGQWTVFKWVLGEVALETKWGVVAKDILNSVQSNPRKTGVRGSVPLCVQLGWGESREGKQNRKNVRARGKGGRKLRRKNDMKCKVAHIHKPPSQKSCFFTHKWLRAQIAKKNGGN